MDKNEEFFKKHETSGYKTEVDGREVYRWVCSCGVTRDLPLNSGIWLGVKIQWHKHISELMERKKKA